MGKFMFDLQLFAGSAKYTLTLREEGTPHWDGNEWKDGVDAEAVYDVNNEKGQHVQVRNNTNAKLTVNLDAKGNVLDFKTTGNADNGSFVQVQYGTEENELHNNVIRYYYIGDDGNMLERVEGHWEVVKDENGNVLTEPESGRDKWEFVRHEETARYLQIGKAGDKVEDSKFIEATYTAMTTLDFREGESVGYWSITDENHQANDQTKVTLENIAKEQEKRKKINSGELQGEDAHCNHGLERALVKTEAGGTAKFKPIADDTYLKVTATTTNGISELKVEAVYVDAYGNMAAKKKENGKEYDVAAHWWTGYLQLDAQKSQSGNYADKYATISYTKPACSDSPFKKKGTEWHLLLGNAALGSSFANLGQGDFIDTAATENEPVTLQAGTHTIYNWNTGFQETIILQVSGSSVQVKTNEAGEVTSLSGLSKTGAQVIISDKLLHQAGAGSAIKYDDASKKTYHVTRYTSLNEEGTIIRKEEGVWYDGNNAHFEAEPGQVSFLETTQGSEFLSKNASYTTGSKEALALNDNFIEVGQKYQLSFDKDSEGLFEVSYENRKTGTNPGVIIKGNIASQKTLVTLAAPKSGTKYYLRARVNIGENGSASLSTDNKIIAVDSAGNITWIKPWEENGYNYSDDGVVKVQSPNRPISYCKEGLFNIHLENVAAGSKIDQLNDGDYVSTATLKAGDTIQISGRADGYDTQSYTAAAPGKLVFKGEHLEAGKKMGTGYATLYSGVVKLRSSMDANGSFNRVITTGTDDDSVDDDTVVINQSVDEVIVTVKKGKVTGITGMTTEGGSVIVMERTGSAERYTCLNDEGTYFRREIGTMENGEFVADSTYQETMEYDMPGYNIYGNGDDDDDVDVVTVECPSEVGDTVTTQDLSIGDIVQLAFDEDSGDDVRCYIAGADGSMTFVGEVFKEGNKTEKAMALLDGTVMLSAVQENGYSRVICAGKDGGEAADDVVVMNRSYDNVTVEVKDGQVTSIKGLSFNYGYKGEAGCVIVADHFVSKNGKDTAHAVRYTCLDRAGTVIRKEEGTWDDNKMGFIPDNTKPAEYVRLGAQGDDLYGVPYTTDSLLSEANVKTLTDNKYGLNFDKDSEGIFEISYSYTKDGLGIFGTVSGAGCASITAPKSGMKYYVEACVTMEDGRAKLHIKPWVVSVNALGNITRIPYGMWEDWAGGKPGQRFTIKAPTQKAIYYEKDVPADMTIENVAAGSVIEGIQGRDIISTAKFEVGNTVTITATDSLDDKITYVAGAAGVLKFGGEFYLDAEGKRVLGVALRSGTVQLTSEEGKSKAICAGASESVANDDIIVMNQSGDVVNVTVANGKVTSITGLHSEDKSIIVLEKLVEDSESPATFEATRYTCLGENGNVFKKETGSYTESDGEKPAEFVPDDTPATYLQTPKAGGNFRTTTYKSGELTKIGPKMGLDFSEKGTTAAYYSRHEKGIVEITEDSFKEDARDKSLRGKIVTDAKGDKAFQAVSTEAYLSVTAKTDQKLVSVLSVAVLRAGYNGVLKKDNEGWTGELSISGLKNSNADYKDKYAVLKFDKPKAYANIEHEGKKHNVLSITDAALGSVFTGYGQYDTIESAKTDGPVAFGNGSYDIYHTTKQDDLTTIHVRNFTIAGGQAEVQTDANGEVSWLGNLTQGTKVTLKDEEGSSVVYEYKKADNSYWKTVTELVNGKKISGSHKIAAADVTNILDIKTEDWNFAAGTMSLSGTESLKVGGTTVTAQGSTITVTANGDKYTIGGITDGAEFKVGDQTFHRYSNLLFTTQGDKRLQLAITAGKTSAVASDKLGQLTNDKIWKHAVAADDNYITETVNLALADNAVKAIEKRNAQKGTKEIQDLPTTMSFIHDKYVVEGTKKAARGTTVVEGESYDNTYQQAAGTADMTEHLYDATAAIAGQTITVTDGWTVKAGQHDDTITGATKGSDIINAGAGKNTIKLGGAADTVIVGTEGSQDTITGYASGKDKIATLADGFHYLVKGADLYLTNAEETLTSVDGSQHALLKGAAVSTKAVNINGENYYFGGVKVNTTTDKKTKQVTDITATSAQSNTFNYDAKDTTAHYIGSTTTTASQYNDLAANNPKAKKPGLDTLKVAETADKDSYVTIDLLEKETAKKDKHYVSIDAVDASGMKAAKGVKTTQYGDYKGVNVTADTTGLRFTGSKFADTVTCGGDGKDYIITGLNQGADTVNNFSVGDVIQINGLNAKTIDKLKKEGELDGNGYLIKNDTLTLGTGSLTVNHAAGVQLQVSGNTIQAVSNVK